MRRRLAIVLGATVACLGLIAPTASGAAATTTTVVRVPISVLLGGCTESVAVTGSYNIVTNVTFDAVGGFHYSIVNAAQGIAGVGFATGDKYRLAEALHSGINSGSGSLPYESTFTDDFHLVGQGATRNNFTVHILIHLTVNPDGSVTSSNTDFSAECTG